MLGRPESGGSANVGGAATREIGRLQCTRQLSEREAEGKNGARVIELRRGVDQKSLFRSAWRYVEPGSRIDTDDCSDYRMVSGAYDHRSVDHEETYVTEGGVHCNTAEAEWSVFKPWWNAFRG